MIGRSFIYLILITMTFQPLKGDWTSVYLPTKASTLYTVGALLCNDGTDNTIATTASLRQIGIVEQAKPTSDATTAMIKVRVPRSPNCTMLGDVGSGTPAVANIGKTCDIVSGGLTAAVATDVHHQLVIAGYKSATQAEFMINSALQTLPGA